MCGLLILLLGSDENYPRKKMDFNYGHPPEASYSHQAYAMRYERYYAAKATPTIEVLPEPRPLTRPLADSAVLENALSMTNAEGGNDPLAFPAQRADIQSRQMDVLLEQLAARHVINDQITKDLQYEECLLRSHLDEIQSRPNPLGREGRFEGDLIKQIHKVRMEYHAEGIACWRDTTRVLSDICDRWTEYADQSRKARLMDLDL